VNLAAVAVLAFAATWVLARAAPRLGWSDPGDGARKPQRAPLAPVGGAALLIAWLAAWWLGAGWPRAALGLETWPALALGAAFAVGLADDLAPRGLVPGAKLAGQALAALALVAPALARSAGDPARIALALALGLGAVAAMNALNTWDNADGAAGGLGLLALAPISAPAAAGVAGFLPCNLRSRAGRALVPGLPSAILGDAGSHLLGLALWLDVATWPALLLPLADLLRVCVERLRAGQAPWLGDRRHLAHRLERAGLAPPAVAAVLALAVAPSAWGAAAALRAGSPSTALACCAGSLALWALALGLTRDPCRGSGGPG
jgi:UDP-GlcNAc:undecaprenyl-phosphate GlcNAc-1-phosphate transferase